MTRLETTFAATHKEGRAALVCFLTAGYPDIATGTELLCSLPRHGADIVELGIPFSDAAADGEIIRKASYQALRQGIDMERILLTARRFRKENPRTPLVLMGYYNPVFFYGTHAFLEKAADAGVDGLILVDLPPEEEEEVTRAETDLSLIHLITPTTDKERLNKISRAARGFLYYVSITGITGTRSPELERVKRHLAELAPQLPVAIGFGIKEPQQVREFGKLAQAVVVGSSLLRTIRDYGDEAGSRLMRQVESYARVLKDGEG